MDVGGSANAQTVEAGFRIILKDPKVKAILINIFGGYCTMRPSSSGSHRRISFHSVLFMYPIIVRLQGTNAEEAKKLIEESGLKVQSAILLSEAAALVNKGSSVINREQFPEEVSFPAPRLLHAQRPLPVYFTFSQLIC